MVWFIVELVVGLAAEFLVGCVGGLMGQLVVGCVGRLTGRLVGPMHDPRYPSQQHLTLPQDMRTSKA